VLEKCIISGFADEIDSDIEKQLKLLTGLDQKYIEFRSANGKGVADYSTEEAIVIKNLLDRNGIKVSAIGSPIGKIPVTDDFKKHFETYKHVVELAFILGTPYIRIFSFYIPLGEDPAVYKDEVFQRMQQLIGYAREQNVILLHENEKEIYGDTADRCLELMQAFYGEHFGCTFDFANFVQCRVDTRQAYQLLKQYISYVHIKDALYNSMEVVPPGQGDGHLAEILKCLHTSGYQGFLSLEPHLADFAGLQGLERYIEGRKMSDGEAAYLKAYLELKKLLQIAV
jgi:sugar phosphate isomerase/epimerase